MGIKNYYEQLGVDWNTPPELIAEAFRSKKLECNNLEDPESREFQLKKIESAYLVLSDSSSRKKYDTDYFIHFIKGKVNHLSSDRYVGRGSVSEMPRPTGGSKPVQRSIKKRTLIIPLLLFCATLLGFTTYLNVKSYSKANKVLIKTKAENKLLAEEKERLKAKRAKEQQRATNNSMVTSSEEKTLPITEQLTKASEQEIQVFEEQLNKIEHNIAVSEADENTSKAISKKNTTLTVENSVDQNTSLSKEINKVIPKTQITKKENNQKPSNSEAATIVENRNDLTTAPPAQPVTDQLFETKQKKSRILVGNRPETGFQPYNEFYGESIIDEKSGHTLIIENKSRKDAVVCIINQANGKIYRNVYIRAKDNGIATKIPEGDYYLKSYFGKNWNTEVSPSSNGIKGGFMEDESFESYLLSDQILKLQTDTLNNKVRFAKYKVEFGNPKLRLHHQGIPRTAFF